MLGGLSWFAVPFAFASCLGLAARALLTNVCLSLTILRTFFLRFPDPWLAQFPNLPEPPLCSPDKCRARRSRCCCGHHG